VSENTSSWRRAGAVLGFGWVLFGCGGSSPPPQAAGTPAELAASPGEETASAEGGSASSQGSSPAFNEGVAAIRDGKYDVAAPLFEKVVAEQPRNAQARFYLGVAQQNLNQVPAARASYEKAVQLDPKLSDGWVNLTALLLDAGDAAGALPLVERGLAGSPKHPGLLYNRALALGALGKTNLAVPAYRQALEADPKNVEIKYGYAEALVAAGSKEQGTKLLVELAQGDNVDVLASAGRLLGQLEQFDPCIQALGKALAKKPAAELYVARGLCEHGKKDDDAAFADFKQAIAADPNYAPAHYYAGMHLRSKGKKAEARQALTRAVQLAGDQGVGKAAKHALESL
jgi:tetratricopeptide (TPR) repeat protein